jgi:hypothetical protein
VKKEGVFEGGRIGVEWGEDGDDLYERSEY